MDIKQTNVFLKLKQIKSRQKITKNKKQKQRNVSFFAYLILLGILIVVEIIQPFFFSCSHQRRKSVMQVPKLLPELELERKVDQVAQQVARQAARQAARQRVPQKHQILLS